MSYLKKYSSAEVSTSSMADIAFLLLSFFLMTTVIKSEKGLLLLLPPPLIEKAPIEINERNLFSVQINSQDQYLIEGIRRSELTGMKDDIKKFILNYGHNKTLSDIAGQYLKKGSEIAVSGKLVHRNYETASGEKKYITEINVNDMVMLGTKE